MARGKKNKISGRFTVLEHALQDSDEWKSLSSKAVRVYLLIRRKFTGLNGDDLSLTYSEAKEYFSSATFSKAIKELREKGVIILIRPGGNNRCTIYSIRNKWFRQGPRTSKEFKP